MHELSIATSLVEELEKILKDKNAARVTKVTVRIGRLSGVEIDALEFCMPAAAQGPAFEGCKFEFIDVPVTVHCLSCSRDSDPELPMIMCSDCGSTDVKVTKGKDMILQKVEVE